MKLYQYMYRYDNNFPFSEFEIQFNADTPMVNGDSVLLSFSSTAPVDEATCTVSLIGSADCEFVTLNSVMKQPMNYLKL